eukprot:14533-Pyramimonas_sp.AAC.1
MIERARPVGVVQQARRRIAARGLRGGAQLAAGQDLRRNAPFPVGEAAGHCWCWSTRVDDSEPTEFAVAADAAGVEGDVSERQQVARGALASMRVPVSIEKGV